MANKPWKDAQDTLITQEIEIKIRQNTASHLKMANIKRKTITSIGKDIEKLEPYTHVLPLRL